MVLKFDTKQTFTFFKPIFIKPGTVSLLEIVDFIIVVFHRFIFAGQLFCESINFSEQYWRRFRFINVQHGGGVDENWKEIIQLTRFPTFGTSFRTEIWTCKTFSLFVDLQFTYFCSQSCRHFGWNMWPHWVVFSLSFVVKSSKQIEQIGFMILAEFEHLFFNIFTV